MNNTNGDFNRVTKFIFSAGGFLTFILAFSSGRQMSQIYGTIALYVYPLLAFIYAYFLFSIIISKKGVYVWLTFGWLFIKSVIEGLIIQVDFLSPEFSKAILSNVILILAISFLLLLKRDGKSGWEVLM